MIEKVEEFHKAFGIPLHKHPTIPIDRVNFRHSLLLEEVEELKKASQEQDIVETLDAIVDCLYVLLGTAHEFGLASFIESAFSEVHASNMSKLGEDGKPIYREDTKVMKGPNYFKPNLLKILENGNSN